MPRIDNAAQLRQLHLAYVRAEAATGLARQVQQSAEATITTYLELLSTLIGQRIPPGQRVTVDFESGEVSIEEARPNGVVGVS